MKQIKTITLATLSLVLLIGCGDDKVVVGPDPTPARFLMPLAVGNSWRFLMTDFDVSGAVEEQFEYVFEVTRDTSIGGENWSVVEVYSPIAPTRRSTYLYGNREDGLWVGSLYRPPTLAAKYPAQWGDSWILPGSTTKHEVSKVDTSVTTPAGTFTCIKYSSIDTEYGTKRSSLMWSPGVGPIVSESYAISGFRPYVDTRLVLKSYQIGS